MATRRPATEWIYDDLGRMKFSAAYDFTSAEFDGEFVGIVFAYTEGPDEPENGDKRVQLSMKLELAEALVEALSGHVQRLRAS